MPNFSLILFVFCAVVLVAPNGAYAFGAGNIPSFAYLEGKAFRHGDIEDVLAELLKRGGTSLIHRGGKFRDLDIKRVYFGNWLRDYSQAVDVAGLKATTMQNIMNIIMVLGFLAHGYVTEEFQVTPERLGVYLPVEHIDNPRGYGEKEDARKYHPKLRGPVHPQELEIDVRTGMKNYIANEDGHWDTSKALVRRTLEQCIQMGRQYRKSNIKSEQYEAFRLLGTALHTLEDFPAHSNFCELALVSLGYTEVFTHVGDRVRLRAPNGKSVPPLVTGTFGGDDFVHSLLGEATDHISQASVTDINQEVENAKVKASAGTGSPAHIKQLLSKIPGVDNLGMNNDVDQVAQKPPKDPSQMDAKELNANVWRILSFRDALVKKISMVIERIPGLSDLIDNIMDSISVFIFLALEPYLKPILQVASNNLMTASGAVISSHDQEEVFRDAWASDPTHSFLSKDHFNLILNEPAGNLAKIIVIHTVKAVIQAWDNPEVPVRSVTEGALECLFHPDFHNPGSGLQREMLEYMRTWIHAQSNQQDLLRRLSKESVWSHQNIRDVDDSHSHGGVSASTHGHAHSHSHGHGHSSSSGGLSSSLLGKVPGLAKAEDLMSKLSITPPGFPPPSDKPHKANKQDKPHKEHKHQASQPSSYPGYGGAYASHQAPAAPHIPPPGQSSYGGMGFPQVSSSSSAGQGSYGGMGYPKPGKFKKHKKRGLSDDDDYSDGDDDDDDDDDDEGSDDGKGGKKYKKEKKEKKGKKEKKDKNKDKDKHKHKDKHSRGLDYDAGASGYPGASYHTSSSSGQNTSSFPEALLYNSSGHGGGSSYAPPGGSHSYSSSYPSAPGFPAANPPPSFPDPSSYSGHTTHPPSQPPPGPPGFPGGSFGGYSHSGHGW